MMGEKAVSKRLSAVRSHSVLAPTKTPQLASSIENKRKEDAKGLIKKLLQEQKTVYNGLVNRRNIDSNLSNDNECKKLFVRKIYDNVKILSQKESLLRDVRDRKLLKILRLQTRYES